MIRVLIFCVLAQNVVTNNFTSKEMAEALKYFEAMHAKHNHVTQTTPLKKIWLDPPKPNDLLTVLHNLSPLPNVPDIKPLEETKPLLESRENQEGSNKEGYKDKTNEDTDQENADRHITVQNNIVEEERKKFQEFLKQLFREGHLTPLEPIENLKNNLSDVTAASKATANAERRRVFNWFKNLFGRATTVAPSTEAPKRSGDITITDVAVVLDKLNTVLDKLNENIENERLKANKSDAFFVLKLPVKAKTDIDNVHFRRKREVKSSVNVALNNTKSNNVSENVTDHNQTLIDKDLNLAENLTKTQPEVTGNSFKSKILAHLIDSFNEIKYKIAPLAKVKEDMSWHDLYKIGYIAASIDTLEENLNKLMKQIERYQREWDETKILDFFDKLKTSNRVLRTLMQYLELLAEKKQVFEVKNLEEVAPR